VKLGIVNGTNFDSMLQEHAPNASVQRFPSTSEVMAAFQTGQIVAPEEYDAVFINRRMNELDCSGTLRGAIKPKEKINLPGLD
ncbi:hypothetical protein, partial [Brucella tritici]|uniref:hypothetical protein n=1 Tax=Brucella tritici TaxID=94626 RepID=UPI0039A26010